MAVTIDTIQLRDYQESFVKEIRHKLFKYERIVAAMATGGGKTVVFLAITRMAINAGRTVLLLTESTKIFPQIADSCDNAVEISAGVKDVPLEAGNIYVAMAQTLVRRPVMVDFFNSLGKGLIIITDEAHIGTPTKLLQQMPDAYHIGFTATPDFRAAKHLPALYNEIVVGPQPAELVEHGHLSAYTHLARTKADLSGLQKDSRGEFSERSQELVFEKPVVYEGLLEDLKNTPYSKCLIFTASIGHCERLTEQLASDGLDAVAVHSLADPEAIKEFTHGAVNICVSVGMLTKGIDYPPIDLVVLQRATTSLPLYLQMIGRGSRTCSGKAGFTVLDYGDNYKRHNLWIVDRDWGKMWKGKDKKGEGVAPVKDCPACGYIVNTSVMACPGCGHVFEKKRDDEPPAKTELIDVTADFNRLRGRKIVQLLPLELAIYAKYTGKKAFAIRVAKAHLQAGDTDFIWSFAKAMGYKKGWVLYQIAEVEETTEKIEFHNITLK